MTEIETRQAVQRGLEEVVNTLVAASTKVAQLQLEAEKTTADPLSRIMSDLAPVIETAERLRDDYQMETNRLEN